MCQVKFTYGRPKQWQFCGPCKKADAAIQAEEVRKLKDRPGDLEVKESVEKGGRKEREDFNVEDDDPFAYRAQSTR